MDFVLDLPQASSGEGFQISFEQMAFLGTGPLCREREREGERETKTRSVRLIGLPPFLFLQVSGSVMQYSSCHTENLPEVKPDLLIVFPSDADPQVGRQPGMRFL